jgi:hypothetical protein
MNSQFKAVEIDVNEHATPYQRVCKVAGAMATSREWYARTTNEHSFHRAVYDAMNKGFVPDDAALLAMEWPHASVEVKGMLAYTRNEQDGERNKQTRTTIGKYLRRHFSGMTDHTIRDLVALHTIHEDRMEIRRDVAELVQAAHEGPHSCMSSYDVYVTCDDNVRRHPYCVYDPALGWGVAVRLVEGRIDGRALINSDGDVDIFVRSFKRDHDGGYSYSDEKLEAWLQARGYTKAESWEGRRLRRYQVGNRVLAAYLDGECRQVTEVNASTLVVDYGGEYDFEVTDGVASRGGRMACECCSVYYDECDMHCVGHDSSSACEECFDEYYHHVYGRGGEMYYVHENYVVTVNDTPYDENYLYDNNIVCDVDGDYQRQDDCVYVKGEWYLEDDDRVVRCVDEEYRLRRYCTYVENIGWYHDDDPGLWVCSRTGLPHHCDTVEPVFIGSETVHPEQLTEEERHEHV